MALFEALQNAIKAKQKINSSTLGLRTKAAEEKTSAFEAEADRLHRLVLNIRLNQRWRNEAICVHTLHTVCSCGRSFDSPQGLLLKQANTTGSLYHYIEIKDTDTLESLPIVMFIRQQKVALCFACSKDRATSTEYSSSAIKQLPLLFNEAKP